MKLEFPLSVKSFFSVSIVCKNFFVVALAASAGVVGARAEVAWRETIPLVVVSNTGIGRSMYAVGNQPELGMWQPTGSVRLAWSAGNVWSGRVAVRAGTTVEVQYISRSDVSAQHCVNTNVSWPGVPNATSLAPAHPAAPYVGKTMFYHSSWTNAFVLYSIDGTIFTSAAMSRIGDGRAPGEYLYRADGFAVAGRPVQFVCNGYLAGTQYWDNAPYFGYGTKDYYTPLDVFFLQDGHVYDYWPPAAPSSPVIVTQAIVSSWAPTIPNRNIRIYLPRGYTNNTWKRYPVLYMHDGQNLFNPGGAVGSWGVEHTMNREVSQGRVREAIVVGIDNTSARCVEYSPPGDISACGGGLPGTGDLYGHFIVHNVRPTLDINYRTLNDRANTFTMGSSLGGLISSYLVLRTNVFGGAGIMSPSWWAAPNFRGWIASNDTLGARLYVDGGTEEGGSLWNHIWPVRGSLLQDGYTENLDLLTVIGCGQAHDEFAWSNRLPRALQFLLRPWDEPNRLAQQTYPPSLEWAGVAPTSVAHRTLFGFRYRLEAATNALGDWSGVATSAVVSLPWSDRIWPVTNAEPVLHFRVFAEIP